MIVKDEKKITVDYKRIFLNFFLVTPLLIALFVLFLKVEKVEIASEIKNIEEAWISIHVEDGEKHPEELFSTVKIAPFPFPIENSTEGEFVCRDFLSRVEEKEKSQTILNIKNRYRFFKIIYLSTIALFAFLSSLFWENRRVINERIKLETLLDPLTGLWNRRYMMDRLAEEFQRIERYGGEATIVLVDLGNFKKVNDLLGHSIGDKVLIEVGKIFEHHLRGCDVVSRHGGDEFLLYFPSTSEENSKSVMERLTRTVMEEVKTGENIKIMVDWGVKKIVPSEGIDRTIKTADDRMYAYKKARKAREGISDR